MFELATGLWEARAVSLHYAAALETGEVVTVLEAAAVKYLVHLE